jgi:hypothetical protein
MQCQSNHRHTTHLRFEGTDKVNPKVKVCHAAPQVSVSYFRTSKASKLSTWAMRNQRDFLHNFVFRVLYYFLPHFRAEVFHQCLNGFKTAFQSLS